MRSLSGGRLARRTLVAAAATCLLTALVFVQLGLAVSQLRDTSYWTDHSARVTAASYAAEKAVVDLDTSQRAFAFQHRPAALGSWRSARATLPARMHALELLVDDNQAQQQRARVISGRIGDYVRTWSAPLVHLAQRDPAGAVDLGRTYGGTSRLRLIRSEFRSFNTVEQRLSRQRGASASDAATRAILTGIAGLGAVLLLVLGFSLYVVRTVVRPVRAIAHGAAAVGAGDLSVRVPTGGSDEVGELGRAFNAMSTALERDRDRLNDLTLRLARSNRDLEDFASVASHDLQEPLRKIQLFADRLNRKHGHELSGAGPDYLDRMQRSAGRLQELIQDLLTLSRVSTEARPFAPVDLAAVGKEVVADLEASIEDAGAVVELDELPTVEADPLQMRQLLQNLISNAIKFRRPEVPPLVRVSTGPVADGHCMLIVEDNGIGFDQKHAQQIFTVFERLHSRAEYDGSGVGLAVCRRIAHRHNGEIAAVGSDDGARFLVVLPIRQQAAVAV